MHIFEITQNPRVWMTSTPKTRSTLCCPSGKKIILVSQRKCHISRRLLLIVWSLIRLQRTDQEIIFRIPRGQKCLNYHNNVQAPHSEVLCAIILDGPIMFFTVLLIAVRSRREPSGWAVRSRPESSGAVWVGRASRPESSGAVWVGRASRPESSGAVWVGRASRPESSGAVWVGRASRPESSGAVWVGRASRPESSGVVWSSLVPSRWAVRSQGNSKWDAGRETEKDTEGFTVRCIEIKAQRHTERNGERQRKGGLEIDNKKQTRIERGRERQVDRDTERQRMRETKREWEREGVNRETDR